MFLRHGRMEAFGPWDEALGKVLNKQQYAPAPAGAPRLQQQGA